MGKAQSQLCQLCPAEDVRVSSFEEEKTENPGDMRGDREQAEMLNITVVLGCKEETPPLSEDTGWAGGRVREGESEKR